MRLTKLGHSCVALEKLQADPELTLGANRSITEQVSEFGNRVHETRHGDALSFAGFSVHVYGVDHALIHQDIPLVVNNGFLVEGELRAPRQRVS